jgi:IclR family pca regulon transcriptional regulator
MFVLHACVRYPYTPRSAAHGEERNVTAISAREPGGSESAPPPEHVQSLDRGLAVICAFTRERPELTLSDAARAIGVSRSTARRSLLTLQYLGYVGLVDGRFHLLPRVLDLGYAYLSSLGLPEIAQPHLEALTADLREASSVAVLDGADIVYVNRVSTERIMRITINVGTHFPAYATSMGRVMLAARTDAWISDWLDRTPLEPFNENTVTDRDKFMAILADVRSAGFSLVDQELERGLRSIAVPVRNRRGEVIAAANVSLYVISGSPQEIERRVLTRLRQAAGAIERDLRSGKL